MANIMRWDPFAELNTLHQQVNSLFNETFGGLDTSTVTPATDVYSDDKGLTVEVQLPNFNKDEIKVNQSDDTLEISAEHSEKEADEKKGRNYLMRQSVSQYYRRFALPKNADGDNVDASFEGGILKVHVPYKELPAPKQVAINAKSKK